MATTPLNARPPKVPGMATRLESLPSTRTAVTSAGVSALSGLKALEVVNLTDTGVDDSGVAPLRALPALRRLWLHGTRVSSGDSGGG